MKIVNKLFKFLSHKDRNKAFLLIIMAIIMALLETLGVASILPFMTILSNPSLIETNLLINRVYSFSLIFGVKEHKDFFILLGIVVFILFIFTTTFKAITTYLLNKFIHMREHSIGKILIETYLRQPYAWFLNRNSAELGKNILSEAYLIMGNGFAPLMNLISQLFIASFLIILLLLIDTKTALIMGLSFAFFYSVIYLFTKKILLSIGKKRIEVNENRFSSVQEAFRAIKIVKASNLEEIYLSKFYKNSKAFVQIQSLAAAMNLLPKFLLEIIAFGGIILFVLFILFQNNDFSSTIPIVILYTFAGYRILPALQQIYASLSQLKYISPSLDTLHNDIYKNNSLANKTDQIEESLSFKKFINLKDISFSYDGSPKKILKNISFTIQSKSIVGIVGPSGSGKTTIIDIILGILNSSNGSIEIDDIKLTAANIKSWQKLIGYVPQNVYLSDDTLASNIAFGVEKEKLNKQDLIKASKNANLDIFVERELELKYETIVGEQGVRLSGGQRQRIGIARALYHSPKFLILDEATSSLDSETENKVMNCINSLKKDITILIVAHRISTLKNCDKILVINDGKLVAETTYDNLYKYQDSLPKNN